MKAILNIVTELLKKFSYVVFEDESYSFWLLLILLCFIVILFLLGGTIIYD